MSLLHEERLAGVDQRLVDFCHYAAEAFDWDVVVAAGLRSEAVAESDYAKGRTTPGPGAGEPGKPAMGYTVTQAKTAAETAHGRGGAVDAAPVLCGIILWADILKFRKLGEFAKTMGLVWGGDWPSKDMDHFEVPNWRDLPYPPSTQEA